MASRLLEEVTQFLTALEAAQEELLSVYKSRRAAMTAARAAQMQQLAEAESKITAELQKHLAERQRILEEAARNGYPSDSVLSLVSAIAGSEREELEERIVRSRLRSEKIRKESWVQWIVSQRALLHYNEMLNLIAECGKRSPTYSREPNARSAGGAILDASV
jgi:hypothetical protein